MATIKLGDRVKDAYTGFTGIATGYCRYLYGCSQYLIAPEKLHDGKIGDSIWFDEQRVELVKSLDVRTSPSSTATTGGPQRHAPKGPSRR